jgi:Restriction alleviation protein Lar
LKLRAQDARLKNEISMRRSARTRAQGDALTAGLGLQPFMASNEALKPCPVCGKREGKLIENKPSRFPFRVQCTACGWMTDQVKLAAVAVKLWNEAKREGKARARPK